MEKFYLNLLLLTTVYFITIDLSVGFAPNTNYCDSSICWGSGRHIGCNATNKIAASCEGSSEFYDGFFFKDYILFAHNHVRNAIAGGRITNFLQAEKMPIVEWDQELAYLAGLNVKTCNFGHDQCHNTRDYKYSGQNLYFYGATGREREIPSIFKDAVYAWFSEKKSASMGDIRKISAGRVPTVGHFTVLVNDNVTKVGCAMLKTDSQMFQKHVVACNYDYTNVLGEQVYKPGTAASKCLSVNSKYRNLCNPV